MLYGYGILWPVFRTSSGLAATAAVAAWSQLVGVIALALLWACVSVDPGLVSRLDRTEAAPRLASSGWEATRFMAASSVLEGVRDMDARLKEPACEVEVISASSVLEGVRDIRLKEPVSSTLQVTSYY